MKITPRSLSAAVLASVIFCLTLHCATEKAFTQTQEAEPALEGLDPVLLSQGKEVQGEFKITVIRGRFQYLFANEENKAVFLKDPARFEIQLDGHCARMGPPVGSNPDLFTVHEGRIYVFGSEECKKMFEATPEKYLESGNRAGLKAASTSETLKKGQALIEKAVVAMGGGTRIDSLSSYVEKNVALQTRDQGDVEVRTNLTVIFPDRIRIDRMMPDYRDPSVKREQGIVIVPREAFIIRPRESLPLPNAYRVVEENEVKRKPLFLLRARMNPGFHPVAIGAGKVGDTPVEEVGVEVDGAGYRLSVDPANGKILSITSWRRGPRGNFGRFTQVFSDFRDVDGLNLPFKVTATFDGTNWKEQSSTIEMISVNGKPDLSLFEKPRTNKEQ
jgi:YHS domain-containing protein